MISSYCSYRLFHTKGTSSFSYFYCKLIQFLVCQQAEATKLEVLSLWKSLSHGSFHRDLCLFFSAHEGFWGQVLWLGLTELQNSHCWEVHHWCALQLQSLEMQFVKDVKKFEFPPSSPLGIRAYTPTPAEPCRILLTEFWIQQNSIFHWNCSLCSQGRLKACNSVAEEALMHGHILTRSSFSVYNELYACSVPGFLPVKAVMVGQRKHLSTWPWVLYRSCSRERTTPQGGVPAQLFMVCISLYCLHLETFTPVSCNPQRTGSSRTALNLSLVALLSSLACHLLHEVETCIQFSSAGLGLCRAVLVHLLSYLFVVAVTFHSFKEWDQKPLQQTLLSLQPTLWITFEPAKCQQCK